MSSVRALSARTAHTESKLLTKNLANSCPTARSKQAQYESLGDYRPAAIQGDGFAKNHTDDAEFHEILAVLGEKCRQKFSKAREVFRFIDSDHSGTIDRGEVHYFFRFFNITEVEADKFFNAFTKDDNDEIAYVDFVKYLWPHINPGNDQVHWCMDKHLDADKYKLKTYTQHRTFTRACVSDEVPEMELPQDLRQARINIAQRLDFRYKSSREAFRHLDENRDGCVSREEIRAFLTNMGWESVADKFTEVLLRRGRGEIRFQTFASLFTISKDSDLRLRL